MQCENPKKPGQMTKYAPGGKRRIKGWRQAPSDETSGSEATEHDRAKTLTRLLPLWPAEIEAEDDGAAARIVVMLERALRAERQRGRAGHWCYDMNRHVALARALRTERARLADLRRKRRAMTRPGTARRSPGAPESKAVRL